jgi:hypothetical protein
MSWRTRVVWGARTVAVAQLIHLLGTIFSMVGVSTGAVQPANVSNPATVTIWAMSLSASLSFAVLLIAWFALPAAPLWAIAAVGVPLVLVGVPRVISDPACTVDVLTVHGCHTFLGTYILAFVGLLLVIAGVAVSGRARRE